MKDVPVVATRSQSRRWPLLAGAVLGCLGSAHAAIPPAERQVLIDLYQSTNGANWRRSQNWNGAPGTECTWKGVTCDAAGTHVVALQFVDNHMTGSLPTSLVKLRRLTSLGFSTNGITGPLPPLRTLPLLRRVDVSINQFSGSLPRLPASIETFSAGENNFTGPIPSLTGLANLRVYSVYDNQLTGSIPSLTGLANLFGFYASDNQLTGSIPALAGLPNLTEFFVDDNALSGPLPPLTGLPKLQYFYLNGNALSGSIPSLQGLPSLYFMTANDNQFSGTMPDFSGLQRLYAIRLQNNQLSGSIPTLTNLPGMNELDASGNQLAGTIPSLDGMPNLQDFDVTNNQLSGTIPSLANLQQLNWFDVAGNQLTGPPPAVPVPNGLIHGNSSLCPNLLDPVPSAEWDAATGMSPWYQNCL